MDSLDWSRKFDIFSISRLSLNASGIPVELVKSPTDEDMHAIAEFVTRLYIAEKEGRSGRTEPMKQTSDA